LYFLLVAEIEDLIHRNVFRRESIATANILLILSRLDWLLWRGLRRVLGCRGSLLHWRLIGGLSGRVLRRGLLVGLRDCLGRLMALQLLFHEDVMVFYGLLKLFKPRAYLRVLS